VSGGVIRAPHSDIYSIVSVIAKSIITRIALLRSARPGHVQDLLASTERARRMYHLLIKINSSLGCV